jgi:hypothetical protein
MNVEIRTERVGTKWHGYIDGRPDIDETALTEEAARRKAEQLRDRFGACGVKTTVFGGRTCELVNGHCAPGSKPTKHRSGSVTWFDAPHDDARA